ncbi:MAG: BON domain-containing protein [Thiohalomonas sp.]|nr:BON domain-containing protein [Thiohalomonas sp.]
MNNKSILTTGLIAAVAQTMSACSTVRDTTDWIPGVDSNEEIKAEEQKEMRAAIERERELYGDKNAFSPISRSASEAINPEDIGIEVNAGVVTLAGNVSSNEGALIVISIAKSTQGVSRVISKLVVINVRPQE